MNGQTKNYDNYLKSLNETPGPIRPNDDKVINIRLLMEYLKETGKKAKELTPEELAPFWVIRKERSAI